MVTPFVPVLHPPADMVTPPPVAVTVGGVTEPAYQAPAFSYLPGQFSEDLTVEATDWALANGFTAPNVPPPPPGTPVPAPPSMAALYKVIDFLDVFPGVTYDTTKWEPKFWYAQLDTANDIPNNDGGVADVGMIAVANGILTLSATSRTPLNAQSWLNGFLDSAPFYATPAGGGWYAQARMRMCGGQPGTWPCFVLYEDNDVGPQAEYAELDVVEAVNNPPGYRGQLAYQSWHGAGSSAPHSQEIGGLGIDLSSAFHTYGVSVDKAGNVQYWFDGVANGPPLAVGANALERMFLNVAMTTGGKADDGWAGVPTAATPTTVTAQISHVGVWKAA